MLLDATDATHVMAIIIFALLSLSFSCFVKDFTVVPDVVGLRQRNLCTVVAVLLLLFNLSELHKIIWRIDDFIFALVLPKSIR